MTFDDAMGVLRALAEALETAKLTALSDEVTRFRIAANYNRGKFDPTAPAPAPLPEDKAVAAR